VESFIAYLTGMNAKLAENSFVLLTESIVKRAKRFIVHPMAWTVKLAKSSIVPLIP